jgi:hypothetical protein
VRSDPFLLFPFKKNLQSPKFRAKQISGTANLAGTCKTNPHHHPKIMQGGPDAKADPFAQRQEFRIGSPPDATPATTKPPDDLANPPPPDDIAKPAPPPRTDAVSATSQHLSSSASTSGRRRHRTGRCLMQRRAHHIEQQQLLQVLHPRSLLPPGAPTPSLPFLLCKTEHPTLDGS